jgi:hypothetical protein
MVGHADEEQHQSQFADHVQRVRHDWWQQGSAPLPPIARITGPASRPTATSAITPGCRITRVSSRPRWAASSTPASAGTTCTAPAA